MKNENKYKSIESERFINAINLLIDSGLARSFKEVAEKSGFTSQDFTDMKSGKKDLQRHFLDKVARHYPISEVYVLTGEGQPMKVLRSVAESIIPDELLKQERPQQSNTEAELELIKKLYAMQEELLIEVKKDRDRLQRLIDEKTK